MRCLRSRPGPLVAHNADDRLIWISVGLIAQLLFSMRFLVQWIATEKARVSIMPESFWYFSFFGGSLLLAYACYRVDPVFISARPPVS